MNAATMPHPPNPVQSAGLPARLIFVRQQFTPYGGGELILDRIVDAIAARGVRPALVCRSWTGREDVEIIRCDPRRFPRSSRERRFARAACERLAGEADALVQSHERMPCCDIYRAGEGVHAAYLEQRARKLSAPGRAMLRLHPFHCAIVALERETFASPRLQAVLVNSAMVADDLVRHFSYPRQRIHLVPNGIDLARYRSDARERHRTEVRRRLGVDQARPVILFVGSGYKRKGLDAAIAALAASRSDAELWVVGSDSRAGHYRAIAERAGLASRFRAIGPVPDVLPYYAGADALLLPSIYDPFPSTAIEALACGLPVVTSTACGARDAAAQLDPMLVRDAHDVAGLAEALRRALELAGKPATTAASRVIAAEYDIDRMVERLLTIYAELRPRG